MNRDAKRIANAMLNAMPRRDARRNAKAMRDSRSVGNARRIRTDLRTILLTLSNYLTLGNAREEPPKSQHIGEFDEQNIQAG